MDDLKLCTADLHLHTNLSSCAPRESVVESYLPHCASEGVELLGIANHLYSGKGVEHVLKIREEIANLGSEWSQKILVGCEAEVYNGKPQTISKSEAAGLDYLLLAPSHIFNQIGHYDGFDLSTSGKIRDLVLENFKYACSWDLGVPTGICHPLYPICAPRQQEILNLMTDEQLVDCYTLAAKSDKSIEIHACLYRNTVDLDEEGLSPSYIRMLTIAKECGCKFHFGSDAHNPDAFIGKHRLLERAAVRAGICKNNLWEIK